MTTKDILCPHKNKCQDCGINIGTRYVFEFDEEDGKRVKICKDCYNQHEEKGDWVS